MTINPVKACMYRKAVSHAFAGQINWLTGTNIKAMLLNNAYAFADTDEFLSDVSGHEVSGSGYARITLSGQTIVLNEGTEPTYGSLQFFAADNSFGTVSISDFRWIVLFSDSGTPSTSPLICAIDYGAQSISADTLAVAFSGGVFTARIY